MDDCASCGRLDEERDEWEAERIRLEQLVLDLRRAKQANKSRWKNCRRDFLAVREERDRLRASHGVLRALVSLKDGPRDGLYERLKEGTWEDARRLVGDRDA